MTRCWVGDLPAGTAFRFTGDRETARRALRGRILRHRPDAVLVCISRTWREGNNRRGGRREDLTWWCRSVYVEPLGG